MNLFRVACVCLLIIGAVSTHFIDYGYLAWVARRTVAGRPVTSCLDLPEQYWRRIPKCMAGQGVPHGSE